MKVILETVLHTKFDIYVYISVHLSKFLLLLEIGRSNMMISQHMINIFCT